MANDPKTDPPADPPEGDNKPDEEAFWKKLDDKIEAGFDRALDKRIAAAKKSGNPSNRNGGRRTLPDVLADLVWPQK